MKSGNTFSTPATDGTDSIIKSLVLKKTGETAVDVVQLPGGANSFVFHVLTENGKEYLAKKYIARKGDTRDRIRTEYSGLFFLWNNGARSVPEPVFMDSRKRIALYSFIKGRKLKSDEITSAEVEQAAVFLKKLCSLVTAGNSGRIPAASEACFSMRDYIDCIEKRLKRLGSLRRDDIFMRGLQAFLHDDYIPAFNKMKKIIEDRCLLLGIEINGRLAETCRILSPSDFGFHNVIKRSDGSLAFIDFEYFGWDDPAKLVADFFLQPEVPMPSKYRSYFLEKTRTFMDRDDFYLKRLPLAYILSALKWCLIMLNVFVWSPDENASVTETYTLQLEKAKNKLASIAAEFLEGSFPISLLEQGA